MQVEVTSSYLELGLVFIGSVTVAVLTILLCTCFKKSRGSSIDGDHKNGNILTTRHSGTLDPEFEDTGLKGTKATSHRRLPDIPDPVPNCSDNPDARQSSVRSSQDTSSELYAQVEIGATANSFPVNPTNGKEVEASRPGPSFNPQPEETPDSHPYDKVKSNHGYSKIKKKAENPYAKVKRSDTMESENAEGDENETDTDNYDVVYTLRTVDETKKPDSSAAAVSVESSSLLPPPLPLPLRGSHSSLVSGDSAPRPPPRGRRGNSIVLSHASSSGSNIHRPNSLVMSDHEGPASDAVDGAAAAAAEDELPLEAAGAAQIHFSGDSQASQDSKGYSSISVREPIANLKAQNPGMAVGRQRIGSASNPNRQTESADSHYATVSDAEDSDEMYAAIAELPSVYDNAAGSDTYARITERVEAQSASNAPSNGPVPVSIATSPLPSLQPESELSPSSPLPPAPPSVVLLKQLSSGSSRLHASTLSIASQTSGVGSPKPEKRQANSPLPPTPVSQEPADGSRRSMNVEEMYAKVMKKKSMHSWQSADSSKAHQQQHRGSVDLGFLASRDTDSYVTDASRRNSADFSSHRTVVDPAESVIVIEPSIQESAVPVVEEDDDDEDLRYEVLPAARNDRKASESDPGYERIQLKCEDSFNEPRYERIQPKRDGEVEPNYEVVGFQGTCEGETSEHGYETVELPTQAFDRQDPNYESLHYSVHSIVPDPPYASIMARESDSNEEETSRATSETVAEPVVNNNTVDVPVYAQVVKSKRAAVQATSAAPESAPEAEVTFEPTMTVQTQDYSVSGSKNTTIIRITDNSPSYRFFADQDSFGVPEQV